MKKLMIAAAAVAMVGGAFADPLIYDFKASVKHTYLKAKKVNTKIIQGAQIYLKYTKSSSLQGYLIQDVDGVLGRRNGYISETYEAEAMDAEGQGTGEIHSYTRVCDVRRITKNDAQPGNRCFLVVMNKSAEKAYRTPRIIPGIIDAKWYDDQANGQTTVPAQGYLYLGGEVVARSRQAWETPIVTADDGAGNLTYMKIRDFEGFNGTKFVALDGMPGSNWGTFRHFYDNQRLETIMTYPSEILNMADDSGNEGDPTPKADAMALWRNNWRDLWFVNERPDTNYVDSVAYVPEQAVTRTAEFGIDDYWFTSAYLFGQFNQPAWNLSTVEEYADSWLNCAGFGKAGYLPGKIKACCGRDLGSKATAYAIKQLSGTLKAGIYLCTENGDDSSHSAILQRTGVLEDQLWLSVRENSWVNDVDANYWGLDGAYALVKQDIWADGNLDLATTDVGSGSWSIKATTALDKDIAAKGGLTENVPLAWGFQQPSTGFTRPLVNAIDAAMVKLDKTCKSGISLFGTPLMDEVQDFGLINYSFFKNYLAEDYLGGYNGRPINDNGEVVQ